jgi:hypothetical protein
MFDRSQHPPRAARADSEETGQAGSDRARQEGGSLVEIVWAALIVAVAAVVFVPNFVKAPVSSEDVDVKANLELALVSARSSYEVNQSYDYDGAPLSALSFAAQGSEFDWTTGSCEGRSPTCVSERVVDVYVPGDGQGVVLAVWSSLSNTCWYGLDLETIPHPMAHDHPGVAFEATGTSQGVTDAGLYRAQGPAGASSCSAAEVGSLGLDWLPVGEPDQ